MERYSKLLEVLAAAELAASALLVALTVSTSRHVAREPATSGVVVSRTSGLTWSGSCRLRISSRALRHVRRW